MDKNNNLKDVIIVDEIKAQLSCEKFEEGYRKGSFDMDRFIRQLKEDDYAAFTYASQTTRNKVEALIQEHIHPDASRKFREQIEKLESELKTEKAQKEQAQKSAKEAEDKASELKKQLEEAESKAKENKVDEKAAEDLSKKDKEIENLKAAVTEKNSQISEKDSQLAEKNGQISEKDKEIEALKKLLEEKNAQLAEKDQQIEEQKAQISKLETAAAAVTKIKPITNSKNAPIFTTASSIRIRDTETGKMKDAYLLDCTKQIISEEDARLIAARFPGKFTNGDFAYKFANVVEDEDGNILQITETKKAPYEFKL